MDTEAGHQPVREQASPVLVSLGLPVYNGENYLKQAVESVLAQTYPHFELIISDNGSTDGTTALCRAYAARDARVRYFREDVNRGATWNFNRVFQLSRGAFFRWTAHDDVCHPDLLKRCLAVLLNRPEVVLCHPRTRVIGPAGEILYDYPVRLRTDSPRAVERFRDLICEDHACFQIFGLMRAACLRHTPLMGPYVGADRNLLADLALLGPFQEIPEYLFLRRDHPNTSTRQYPSARDRLAWFRATSQAAHFPSYTRARGYMRSLAQARLTIRERLLCLACLGEWTAQRCLSRLGMRSASPHPSPLESRSAVAALTMKHSPAA